jgi:hypothetical protein
VGRTMMAKVDTEAGDEVSIQLVSPTSGELMPVDPTFDVIFGVSIQLVSPTSGECIGFIPGNMDTQNMIRFHSISFPNEWGDDPITTRRKQFSK